MGEVTYSDGIAIWKLVYYTPAILASIYICCRHGFMKSSGWFFLVIFCLTRLIGSAAQLSTISSYSSTAVTIALVCNVLGTSPLLLSTLGLISRIYYSLMSQMWSIFFQLCVLKIVQTPAAVALILCIVGATSASNPALIEKQSMVHVGIILFLVVWIMIVILTIIAFAQRKKVPDQERVLVKAVVAALPCIFIHILYSIIAAFSDDPNFSPATGSPTASLLMSVLEEMAVVVIYIYAGLKVESTPLGEDASAARTLGYRAGRGDFGFGKLGILSLGLGLVNARRDSEQEKPGDNQQQNYSGEHRSGDRRTERGRTNLDSRQHQHHHHHPRPPQLRRDPPGYYVSDQV